MREIKFRAWDTVTKKMDYEPRIYGCETSCVEYDEVNLNKALARGGDADCGDSRIFEQYTGLKDKNGKEIYEGDIVEYDWYIIGDKPAYRTKEQVVFDDMGARLGDDRIRYCTNVEVIGNIHENPELLEGNK